MKFAGVMILVQMLGGNEPSIETKVLTILPIDECERQIESLNKSMPASSFNKDGKIVMFERRQCALMMDGELTNALKKLEAVPDL